MGIIAAGDMDKRIRIERSVTTKDDHGNDVSTWGLLRSCWARVFYGLGQDRRVAAQDNASQSATFQVRRTALTASVTPADRISFRGLAWDINGVAEIERDDIEITATSRKPGGLV